jgi:hypothetical protein
VSREGTLLLHTCLVRAKTVRAVQLDGDEELYPEQKRLLTQCLSWGSLKMNVLRQIATIAFPFFFLTLGHAWDLSHSLLPDVPRERLPAFVQVELVTAETINTSPLIGKTNWPHYVTRSLWLLAFVLLVLATSRLAKSLVRDIAVQTRCVKYGGAFLAAALILWLLFEIGKAPSNIRVDLLLLLPLSLVSFLLLVLSGGILAYRLHRQRRNVAFSGRAVHEQHFQSLGKCTKASLILLVSAAAIVLLDIVGAISCSVWADVVSPRLFDQLQFLAFLSVPSIPVLLAIGAVLGVLGWRDARKASRYPSRIAVVAAGLNLVLLAIVVLVMGYFLWTFEPYVGGHGRSLEVLLADQAITRQDALSSAYQVSATRPWTEPLPRILGQSTGAGTRQFHFRAV